MKTAWSHVAARVHASACGVLLVATAFLLVPARARAAGPYDISGPYDIPRVADGVGVKVGERSTFHGGAAASVGFDSNIYREQRDEDPERAAFIMPSAWLGLGSREVRDGLLMTPAERTGRLVEYNLSFAGMIREYLGAVGLMRRPPWSLGAAFQFAFLPGRRFSIDVGANAFYGVIPGNFGTNQPDDIRSAYINRFDWRSHPFTLIFRPGGGRLSLSLGARTDALVFIDREFRNFDRAVIGLENEVKWRFLPKSSLVFHYTFDYTDYLNNDFDEDADVDVPQGRRDPANPYRKYDNFAHRILGGFRGQIFKRATLDVMIGGGIASYWSDPVGPRAGRLFRGVIGQITFNYYPTLASRIYLSLFRKYRDAMFGNYYIDLGGRVLFSHTFRWRMIAHLGAEVAMREAMGLPIPRTIDTSQIRGYRGPGADVFERHTTVFSVDVGIEQPLGRLFSLALSYNGYVDGRRFEVEYQTPEGAPPDLPPRIDVLGFQRHLVWLIAAVRI